MSWFYLKFLLYRIRCCKVHLQRPKFWLERLDKGDFYFNQFYNFYKKLAMNSFWVILTFKVLLQHLESFMHKKLSEQITSKLSNLEARTKHTRTHIFYQNFENNTKSVSKCLIEYNSNCLEENMKKRRI